MSIKGLENFDPKPAVAASRNPSDCSHPRPRYGKTARDKARGHVPYRANRRIWDRDSERWVKV